MHCIETAKQLRALRSILETGESLPLSWIVVWSRQYELFGERVPEARSLIGAVSVSEGFLGQWYS